jgi:hypothetical protein
MRNRASAYAACLWLLAFALLLGACGPTTTTQAELDAASDACASGADRLRGLALESLVCA